MWILALWDSEQRGKGESWASQTNKNPKHERDKSEKKLNTKSVKPIEIDSPQAEEGEILT